MTQATAVASTTAPKRVVRRVTPKPTYWDTGDQELIPLRPLPAEAIRLSRISRWRVFGGALVLVGGFAAIVSFGVVIVLFA